MLGGGAVGGGQPYGGRELVVLLMEGCVKPLRMQESVNVVEADLGAHDVEDDGCDDPVPRW